MHEFPVPARTQRFTLEIKRSRFVTSLGRADSAAEAKRFIADIRDRWPDANHHCWAYVTGAPGDLRNADKSDDGEPKGTAGMPMLNVLAQSGLGHVVAVVTRYFGGVKLGAGGLVRAYTRCVSDAVQELETDSWLATERIVASLPYSLLASVEHWIGGSRTVITDKAFAEDVQLGLQVPVADREALFAALASIGQGMIKLTCLDAKR